MQLGRLIEAVFQNRQAGPDLARVEHDLAHLEQHLFHLRRGGRVKRRGRGVLPMPTTIIFVSPLCTGPAKHVCSLMRLSTSTPSDSIRVAIHPHVARRNGAELHDVHRRADRHAHRFFGEAERFDHRPLALGRAAVVRAHRGEQERPGAVIAEPIAGGPRDFGDIGDAAAAGRDADIALRHFQLQPIELLAHGRADIRDRIRDQLLMNAKEFHDGENGFRETTRKVCLPHYC